MRQLGNSRKWSSLMFTKWSSLKIPKLKFYIIDAGSIPKAAIVNKAAQSQGMTCIYIHIVVNLFTTWICCISVPMELSVCDTKMEVYKFAIILYCAFTFLKFCHGSSHTLLPNQTMVDGQTLISSNQMFEMGFFIPGSSSNKFLGIWYKTTPEIIVWVANRRNPITNSDGLHLGILRNKSMVIANARGAIVWSANSSGLMSNPVLRLLDTGNLVLFDKEDKVCWQSFDYPTDTLLPGMELTTDIDVEKAKFLTSWKNSDDPSPGDFVLKMENQGLADGVISKGTEKVFRAGTWNGLHFSGSPPFPSFFQPKFVFNGEKMLSMQLPYDDSFFSRLTLHASGSVQHFALNAHKDKWNILNVNPQDSCEEYSKCGPFGICTTWASFKCQCLKGYAPKFLKDWDLQDWSGGCTRITPLGCDKGDHGFLKLSGVKYPDMLKFWLNTSMTLDECKTACSSNCSCVAYANTYITEGGSGCLMWFGKLVDMKYLPAGESKQNVYLRLPNSELDFESGSEDKDKKNRSIMFMVIAMVSGVLVSCFINGGIRYVPRQIKAVEKAFDDGLELPSYAISTIKAATDNFSEKYLIGKGGFGPVYKGKLYTEEIAVKRLSGNSKQGLVEFKNEVTLIAKLQHRNLVKLLGYCIEKEEKILVYEYMQNKSLETIIHDGNQKTLLTWPKRFDIILGIARGMLYLHHDSRLKVIHRDFKTSNILLDKHLNPKISDFGLARRFEEDQSTSKTRRVVGTYGYMSPEYVIGGNFSTKSDIFSLGVVLLEIISGKRNRVVVDDCQYYSLLGNAWLLWKENTILDLMDECLNETFIESQVRRCVQVALLCVQRCAEDRPDMISMYSMLTTNEGELPEPKEPGFFFQKNLSIAQSPNLTGVWSERGTVTITELEAR